VARRSTKDILKGAGVAGLPQPKPPKPAGPSNPWAPQAQHVPNAQKTTGDAHLPGGVGSPGFYNPAIPAPPEAPSYNPAIPAPPEAAAPDDAAAPPPVDEAAEQRKAMARRDYAHFIGDSDASIRRRSSDYGFSYDTDTGARTGLDPTNPYSRATLLQKSYDQGRERSQRTFEIGNRSDLNRYAGRGLLYSGARQRAQREEQRGFDDRAKNLLDAYNYGDDDLKRTFDAFVEQWLRSRRNASTSLADVEAGRILEFVRPQDT
jgi:Predicted membrane protein